MVTHNAVVGHEKTQEQTLTGRIRIDRKVELKEVKEEEMPFQAGKQ